MDNVKVSVIIPVYNSERYLEKCLETVVNQTLRDIEIICVDDGSADKSLEILSRYAESDDRIKILTQKNEYAGAARNNGMAQAQGKYFAFWDSDDYFALNALEILYKKCEQEQADLCLCGAYTFNDGSDKITIDETIIKRRFLPREKVFSIETHPEYIFNIAARAPWNKLVSAEFLRKNGIEFQNLRNANDTYFSFMCMYYAKRITYVTNPLVYYRVNNSESITGKATTDPLCGYKAFAKIYNEMLTNGISDKALQSFYSRLYNGLVRTVLILGEDSSMQTAYNKIRDEGFDYFDINDSRLTPEYCYFKGDLEDMLFIRDHTLAEFLMYKYRKENADRLYYKANAEKTLKIRLARKISRLIPADSALYDKAKKLLKFK